MTSAGNYWRQKLDQWGIPQNILEQAPESPWIHPPILFDLPIEISDSPSHTLAKELEPKNILDIGCGGGIASFATQAEEVIGVDHQKEMLELYKKNAAKYRRRYQTFLGFWPDISHQVPEADVVASHHVLFNVSNIEEFLMEMNNHAKKRVVIEMPKYHPQNNASSLWQHFWGISRPTTPTSDDVIPILHELGIEANVTYWSEANRSILDLDQEAQFARIRLCLPSKRQGEVRKFLETMPLNSSRELAAIWWDK